MNDFLLFALVSSLCAAITGILLFLLLARRLPSVGERLRIAVPASVLAVAFACLVPFAAAVLRGGTVLPPWTAWLLPFAALLILPACWRSVLNRLPSGSRLFVEQQEETPEDAMNPWGTSDEMDPGRILQPAVPAAAHPEKHHHDPGEGNRNLLADIVLHRRVNQESEVGTAPAEKPSICAESGFVQEEPPAREPFEFVQEEPPACEPLALVPEEPPAREPFGFVQEEPPLDEPEDVPADTAEQPHLAPYQAPAGANLSNLLSFALDARQDGRLQDAVSWFLAILASDPGSAVRDGVFLDLCALLLEAGFAGKAKALLASEYAYGTETGLIQAIRKELERHDSMENIRFPDA